MSFFHFRQLHEKALSNHVFLNMLHTEVHIDKKTLNIQDLRILTY